MGDCPPFMNWVIRTNMGKSIKIVPSEEYPYFYCKAKDVERAIEYTKKYDNIHSYYPVEDKAIDDFEDFYKVETYNPEKVDNIRDALSKVGIDTKESKILFKYRVMIDKQIYTTIDITDNVITSISPDDKELPIWHTLFYDLEWQDDIKGPPNPKKQRILSISTVDYRGEKRQWCDDD